MKKHFFVYLFAALTMGAVFTSCGDDDDPTPNPTPKPEVVCPVAETTFNAANGLELSYSGQPMKGKVVKFTPDAKDATKATLVLSGDEYGLMGGKPQAIAGVIPGELSTTINVDLTIDGEKVTFSGKDEKEGRVIEYKGEATKSSMNLTLDVTMPVNVLTGRTFTLVPLKEVGKDKSAPITLKWESDGKIPMFGFPQPIQAILDMVVGIGFPVVEGQRPMNINQMLLGVLGEITFLPDGNIQAKYKKDLKGGELETSPFNVATYTVSKEGKVMLYVNPMQIAFITKAVDMGEIMGGIMKIVSEALINGVPVSYEEKNGTAAFYLDEQVLLPILKQVQPLLEDKETLDSFMAILNSMLVKLSTPEGKEFNDLTKEEQEQIKETANQLMAIIRPMIEAFPEVINKTTKMHFGINMAEKK